MLKAAAADMRYFGRSKFLGSLVHKENFGSILQEVLVRILICQGS